MLLADEGCWVYEAGRRVGGGQNYLSQKGQLPALASDRFGAVIQFAAAKPDTRHSLQTDSCPYGSSRHSRADIQFHARDKKVDAQFCRTSGSSEANGRKFKPLVIGANSLAGCGLLLNSRIWPT